MKKALVLLFILPTICNAQLKTLLKKNAESAIGIINSQETLDISTGLKEALNKGITDQVSKLTQVDVFYKNEWVKIVMPEELSKVDKTMRKLGMGSLADDGIKALNRAAEDAVKEATPVFVNAIKNIKFADAKTILMGNENAATTYLQQSTNKELYAKFIPIVQQSIGKVGADKIWNGIIQKYNTLPLVSKINPDLNDYVTNKALEGVFKMIAIEEKNIRTNLQSRTSTVLKKVFAMQD
ncbi:DUF4197 domain-containing protein [Flavobacterium sp. RSSA_27]|uniref:DUF4197 domain-containing protein n=1 Tax=Flavobacterium sp. RSSA_27 TaxID=3447667 RepID=UPI003F32CBD3